MAQTYFLVMTIGVPLLLLVIAVLAGHFYKGGEDELLDWKPTRSPELEAELYDGDIAQMLAAQNYRRQLRGLPERTLDEMLEHARARIEAAGKPGAGPDHSAP
jgi:hypothetical protein